MRSASRADFARLSLTSLAFSESYLIGRVHCSAKRTPKTHYFLRQPKLDALRWHLSAAPFFDSHRFQKCSGNGRPFEPAQQSLQCGRVVAGDSLSHHPRPRTHRDHAVAATQWGLSISERIVDLSQSQHPQTIPAAHGTPSPAQVAQASRSVPGKDGQQAPSTLASYLRRGFHSPCGLRKTRRGEGWLQPDQAWTAIVSPFALFRRTDEGLLAWGASSRRCSHFQRCTGTPRGVLCQDPCGSQGRARSCRQRVLRPQGHRMAGRKKSPLCHRGQDHQAYQTQADPSALHLSQPRRRGSRVLLSAYSLAASLPLCSRPATSTRTAQRAAHAVQAGQVSLPGAGYEPRSQTSQPLALLQRPSRRGADHPGTQGRLPLGQNSHTSLLCQRCLFSSAAARLQFGQLVQAVVFATRISNCHAPNLAQPDLTDARITPSSRKSSAAGYANQWTKGDCLEIRAAQDTKANALRPFFTQDLGSILIQKQRTKPSVSKRKILPTSFL